MRKQISFYHKISNISFAIAFVLLGSILILGEFYERNNYLNWLLILIGTLLGVFALIKAYIQMKGYEPLVNQYELMQVIYEKAESKIAEVNNLQMDIADIYSALGEKDKAIDALEVEYKLGGDFTPYIPANPIYKPLINEPRFKELVSRFNFPK
jgi:hypothetical protein